MDSSHTIKLKTRTFWDEWYELDRESCELSFDLLEFIRGLRYNQLADEQNDESRNVETYDELRYYACTRPEHITKRKGVYITIPDMVNVEGYIWKLPCKWRPGHEQTLRFIDYKWYYAKTTNTRVRRRKRRSVCYID